MRDLLKKIFCKHNYDWSRRIEIHGLISGERHCYLVCDKCGKMKDTRFISYD